MIAPSFSLAKVDAVEWLRGLPAESVDLIVTDPAYESLEKHRAIGTTTRLRSWFPVFPNERFPALLAECFRVLRPDAHLYLWCDAETMFVVKPIGEAAGFKFWKPLVWDKEAIGMGYHYRARYEFVLFFEKGKRRLNDLGIADVFRSSRPSADYPTEKPVGVLSTLIRQSTREGDLVADPFFGSGSTGAAAIMQGRRFAGTDTNPAAHKIALPRLIRCGGAEVP
jgi:site-specific DNA-methyltransferase (adenine-specific)